MRRTARTNCQSTDCVAGGRGHARRLFLARGQTKRLRVACTPSAGDSSVRCIQTVGRSPSKSCRQACGLWPNQLRRQTDLDQVRDFPDFGGSRCFCSTQTPCAGRCSQAGRPRAQEIAVAQSTAFSLNARRVPHAKQKFECGGQTWPHPRQSRCAALCRW